MAEPSYGVFSKFAVDDSTVTGIGDFDSGSFQYEILSESLAKDQAHIDSGGIRGTRSVVKDRVRIASERIGGAVSQNPTPIELDKWFPRILGAAESTDTFALAETVPEFGVLIDRIAKRFIYTGCKVNKGTFSGGPGQLLLLVTDIEGKTEVESATSFPGTVPAIDSAQGYVMSDVTFALSADASATEVQSFSVSIDNVLDVNRYMNSVTRSKLGETDRIVMLEMVIPYNADTIDLHNQAVAGAAGTLTFTNGGVSTLFTFANLKSPAKSPVITRRQDELFLNLRMRSYMSSSTRELVVTHDSAP